MRRGAALFMLAVALGATPASAESLTARGNEPSWRLDIGADEVTFDRLGGTPFTAPIESRSVVEGHPTIIAKGSEGPLEVKIIQRLCADTMSGMPFPVGVEISYGGQRFTGCGGEIMTAIEGGWRVIRLGNDPPPEGAIITIEFGTDGRVSGKSACNRYTGSYTLSGEGLSLGQLATTRMACPQPLMETEQRVLGLLGKITRVTPGEGSQLRLMAGDDVAMVIDRAD